MKFKIKIINYLQLSFGVHVCMIIKKKQTLKDQHLVKKEISKVHRASEVKIK